MKRLLTAGVAALVLVASQASAVAPNATTLNVADRAGPAAASSNELWGVRNEILALIALLIAAGVWAISEDGSSSP